MFKIGTVETPYGNAELNVARYSKGKSICVQMTNTECYWEPLGMLSVNLPDHNSVLEAPSEFFVKTWSENEPVIAPILASGIFEDTGKRVRTGFVLASVWRIVNQAHIPPLR